MRSELAVPKSAADFVERSRPYLVYLKEWESALTVLDLAEALRAMLVTPDQVAVISVDMINAFCTEGVLASERVQGIVQPIVTLFNRAWAAGVRHFALVQDRHTPGSREFADFGQHAVAGSSEAETVPELATLPYAGQLAIIPKNSISSAIGTDLERWLESIGDTKLFIVVGNCTDLCIHQLATYLKLRANVHGLTQRIVVPANAVATYDVSVERSREIGALPHEGDLLHLVFLNHLSLNGIDVVKSVQ